MLRLRGSVCAGCDVLWGGCPMVTLPLERMASRVAASLCYATGLGHEMVVSSQQEYEVRAFSSSNLSSPILAPGDLLPCYLCRSASPSLHAAAHPSWLCSLFTAMLSVLAWYQVPRLGYNMCFS